MNPFLSRRLLRRLRSLRESPNKIARRLSELFLLSKSERNTIEEDEEDEEEEGSTELGRRKTLKEE